MLGEVIRIFMVPFEANLTTSPTIRIGDTSRTIGKIFMNDANLDEMGIRNTPPNLVYSSNAVSCWFGDGILNKQVDNFFPLSYARQTRAIGSGPPNHSYFSLNGVTWNIHRRVIPEPNGYTLVFGLFAVGL